MNRYIAIAAAVALLAGCAEQPQTFVAADQVGSSADVLAGAVATYVSGSLKGNDRNVVLMSDEKETDIAPKLRTMLEASGVHVVAQTQGVHQVGYRITPFGQNVLVLIFIDRDQATRVFARNQAGGLQPVGPYVQVKAIRA